MNELKKKQVEWQRLAQRPVARSKNRAGRDQFQQQTVDKNDVVEAQSAAAADDTAAIDLQLAGKWQRCLVQVAYFAAYTIHIIAFDSLFSPMAFLLSSSSCSSLSFSSSSSSASAHCYLHHSVANERK